jgi:[acyl-carrier-protein] S-malonyltransferase
LKIALLFAGQGAQYSGMGQDIYNEYSVSKQIFEMAGEEITNWCFHGDKETLRKTEVTQPSIYTVTMACYEAFSQEYGKLIAGQNFNAENENLEIVALAGFSLGEYAALTVSDSIRDFKTGLEIVKKRGKWMGEYGSGGMVAAMGQRENILEIVELAREKSVLEGVNFNSPMQTVVAGDKDALERFCEIAKHHGHVKTVMLSVGNAFHSPLMEPVSGKLYDLFVDVETSAPNMPVYSNATSNDIADYIAEGAKEGLDSSELMARLMAMQVKTPVYWEEIMNNLLESEVEIFIEIGPGKTLSGLLKKIKHDAITFHVQDKESLEHTIEGLKNLQNPVTN